jgi:hypothetical protein
VFGRSQLDSPLCALSGLEKPSVAVRCSRRLYQSRESCQANGWTDLPHRCVFAVLSLNAVLIYDTQQSEPLAVASHIHYASLTDATWSADGKCLAVSSSDGYVSIIRFGDEIGQTLERSAVEEWLPKSRFTQAVKPAVKPAVTVAAAAATTTTGVKPIEKVSIQNGSQLETTVSPKAVTEDQSANNESPLPQEEGEEDGGEEEEEEEEEPTTTTMMPQTPQESNTDSPNESCKKRRITPQLVQAPSPSPMGTIQSNSFDCLVSPPLAPAVSTLSGGGAVSAGDVQTAGVTQPQGNKPESLEAMTQKKQKKRATLIFVRE